MTTSTMTLDMIASRDRAVRILQSSIFIGDGDSLEGGWSVNFPNTEEPERHIFSCRGDHAGVEITIDDPREEVGEEISGSSFTVRITVPKHDFVVLESTVIHKQIKDRDNADLIQTALAKARAIAAAPYGLAALFAAHFEQQRQADIAAQQQDAARREALAKQRERLSAELFALGVEGITLDHCNTGSWYEDEPLWAWKGALVGFSPATSEFIVHVQPYSPDFGEWRLVGSVAKNLRDNESREKTASELLDLIFIAQQRYREGKPAQQPLVAHDDGEDEPLPIYALGYFEQGGREVEFWINDRAAQGYAHLTFTPTLGGWVYVAMRLGE